MQGRGGGMGSGEYSLQLGKKTFVMQTQSTEAHNLKVNLTS